MDCSMPGLPVHHQLPELAQTHVHRVGDAIQPPHPPSSPSPPAFSLSQHQGLFKWVSSSHQVAKVLEFQLWHQSFQWIFRTEMPKCENSAPDEFKWFQTIRNLLPKRTCSIESFCVWGQLYKWVENLPVMQETQVWFLGQGRSPREGNGNSLQYTCLESLMDRGAWGMAVGLQRVGQDWMTNTFTFTQMGVLQINFYIAFLIY